MSKSVVIFQNSITFEAFYVSSVHILDENLSLVYSIDWEAIHFLAIALWRVYLGAPFKKQLNIP